MDEPCTDPVEKPRAETYEESREDAWREPEAREEPPERVPREPEVFNTWTGLLVAGILLLTGMILVSSAAFFDAQEANRPWAAAVLVLGAPKSVVSEDSVPVAAQRIPQAETEFVAALRGSEDGRKLMDALELDKGPHFLAFQERWSEVAELLATGRMPEPGAHEVLAGYLAPSTPFEFGGKTFTVSGRLRASVGSLGYAYLAPNTESVRQALLAQGTSRQGWIMPEGLKTETAKGLAAIEKDKLELVASPGRSSERAIWLCLVGLVFVAIGGSGAYLHVLRWLSTCWHGAVAAPLLQAMARHMKPLIWVHVLLYGAFFLFMALGAANPLFQSRVIGFVQHQFSEGGLSYVGDAYAEGSILKATAATFFQNYFVATIATTLTPSLFIPFAGVIKNLVTFAFAGFAMAPVWLDSAPRMSYHSLTMVLEFEAYIVATFAAAAWPFLLFRGKAGKGLQILAGAVLVGGAMLLFAALYEASTLILLAVVR